MYHSLDSEIVIPAKQHLLNVLKLLCAMDWYCILDFSQVFDLRNDFKK